MSSILIDDLLWTPTENSSRRLIESAWRYESWLSSYPLTPLTVLDYFKNSPFYDLSCNNERIAIITANKSNNSNLTNINESSIAQRLKKLKGLEYEVETNNSNNNLNDFNSQYYLIKKQYRESPTEIHIESLYYVIGIEAGSPSPLATLTNNNNNNDPILNSSIQNLSSAFHTVLPRGTVIPLPCLNEIIKCSLSSTMTRLNRAMEKFNEFSILKQEMETQQKQIKFNQKELKEKTIINQTQKSTNNSINNQNENNTNNDESVTDELMNDLLIDSLIIDAHQPMNYSRNSYSHLVDEAFKFLTLPPTTSLSQT